MKNKVIRTYIIYIAFTLPLFSMLYAEKRGILAHIPKEASPSSLRKQSSPTTLTKAAPSSPSNKDFNKVTTEKKSNSAIPTMPTPPAQALPIVRSQPVEEETPAPELKPKPPVAPPIETKTEKKLFEEAKRKEEEEQKFRFYFEDATLENIVEYVKSLFNVTFLPDDAIKPLINGGVPLEGHTITFKTNKPISRQEVWNIFLRLLDLSGLTLVPGATPDFYRITAVTGANQLPLPSYFGTDIKNIPNNAMKIRYIYFVKNNPLQTIQNVVTSLASTSAIIIPFASLDALIITDKASNIRSLMEIVNEFDKDTPEAMVVLKLKRTDATNVKTLYESLTNAESPQGGASRFASQRAQPSLYFPADARIIADTRTNSLILLGPKEGLAKIEEFITKHIDTEVDLPYSPLYVYNLQNTSAVNITNILQSVINFGSGTPAGQAGGVRDGQKYFKAGTINITPEPTNNSLIIKAEEADYKKLEEIIKVLDVDQPQVAIEVLIVDVTATNGKSLAAQLRNKSDGSIMKNVNFQSAQINQAQINSTSGSLIGNLIGLATGADNPAGTTLLSIGSSAANGIWGLFRTLKTYTDAKIVENPFLLATNKYQSSFTFGTTRRVIDATVGSSNTSSYGDKTATLTLTVTPQINTEGIVTLDIDLKIVDFTNEDDDTDAGTSTKEIVTSVHVKNKDVIVLGGITKNTTSTTVTKVPLLGSVPILGNLFRAKTKNHIRSNLIIFLSPKIIIPTPSTSIGAYTEHRADEIRNTLGSMDYATKTRDPLERAFFESNLDKGERYADTLEQFMHPDIEQISNTERSKRTSQTSKHTPSKRSSRGPVNRRRRLARRGES